MNKNKLNALWGAKLSHYSVDFARSSCVFNIDLYDGSETTFRRMCLEINGIYNLNSEDKRWSNMSYEDSLDIDDIKDIMEGMIEFSEIHLNKITGENEKEFWNVEIIIAINISLNFICQKIKLNGDIIT